MPAEVRVPGLPPAVANVFVPACRLSFTGHLKVGHAHNVARMIRVHCEFGPAVNAAAEIHEPGAVGEGDADRLEGGLFAFERRHLRKQMIIRAGPPRWRKPSRIVETSGLPSCRFPARIKSEWPRDCPRPAATNYNGGFIGVSIKAV